MDLTLEDVIAFVRKFTSCYRETIDENTFLERDLGVTGDDGVELLEEAENVFGLRFETEEEDFRAIFSLKENEYLFNSEGLDLLGIGYLWRRLRGKPEPVIRDLSIAQLHNVLVKLHSQKSR